MSDLSKLEAIYSAALERTSDEERTAYLNSACDGDSKVRRRIEKMLAAFHAGGSFLESSPFAAIADDLADLPIVGSTPVGEGGRIGPYKLLQKIGEGGFGVVYMAEQQQPVRRQVALKIIKPGMGSRQIIARFEAERQALAMMDHTNIAKVLDAGTTDSGSPYFVMELVRGIPITKYCDQEHLTLQERLELFVPACQALQHAHQKGIIHRDIKPTNILVALYDDVPVPKVIDFGVAKATAHKLTEKTMFTGFGQLIGTLEYMSPEQAQLNQLDIDTRSDIYSLGVLLYELLTGTTPLEHARLATAAFDETLRLIREEEPPRPSTRLSTAGTLPAIAANRKLAPTQLCRQVTGELDWIVMKSLEKDRKRRYETAGALAADVLRYLHDERVLACPPTVAYQVRKFVRRNKGPVLAAGLILLALIGGMVGTTWQMIRATAAGAVAVNEANQKEAALVAARESERDATDRLFLALLSEAQARRYSRQMGQRLDSLAALDKAARIRPDERLRDEAIAAMTLPDVRLVPVPCSAPISAAVGFDGQYRVYARADPQGTISIRSTSDNREIQRIVSGPILGVGLYFSPDDQFLYAVGQGRTLGLWRVADGQRVIRDDYRDCWANAFSSDGRRLAVGQNKSVICFDLATGQEVNHWVLPASVNSLAFHPDGVRLAVGQSRASVVSVYDAVTGKILTDLAVGAMQDQVVAWHPDGERLAVSSLDPVIHIWNVAARRKTATMEGHAKVVPTLTFHPDGSLLASHSWDGTLRLWDPATGRPLLKLAVAISGRPRFSRDGRWLGAALRGEQIELLAVTPTREYQTLVSSAGLSANSNRADCSPDGRLLAVAMDAGTRLWDLHGGRELAALPAGTIYAFFDDSGGNTSGAALLTGGSHGLLRWPIVSDDQAGNRLRLGPPRQLSSLRRAWFARGVDGRSLGVVTVEGGTNQIVDLTTGTVQQELGHHPNGEVIALSRDARWAASSGWHSDRVRLWNVLTGEMVHEWTVGIQTQVYFTPDSRALIISRSDEFMFWDVATLEPTLRLRRDMTPHPGYVAFSPDGKLMAVEMAPAVVHLKEAVSGRTVAKLEDPHGDRVTWQSFTPDGTQLVVASSFTSAIHIWDLRVIRARLKEMNLDWDWPEFAPALGSHEQPVTIEVDLGELAKPALTREQTRQQAIAQFRRDLEANPQSASACNNLAWALLTSPEIFRNPEEAVPLAEKALRLEPENALYRNTLGVAYYRAGRHREAVETLRPNLTAEKHEALAFDLYFLAMGLHRLGEAARARDYYELAVRWVTAQKNLSARHTEELNLFRAEADEVLGVNSDEP